MNEFLLKWTACAILATICGIFIFTVLKQNAPRAAVQKTRSTIEQFYCVEVPTPDGPKDYLFLERQGEFTQAFWNKNGQASAIECTEDR